MAITPTSAEPREQKEKTMSFTVCGKFEMLGFDEMSAQLDMLIAKAKRLAGLTNPTGPHETQQLMEEQNAKQRPGSPVATESDAMIILRLLANEGFTIGRAREALKRCPGFICSEISIDWWDVNAYTCKDLVELIERRASRQSPA